MSKDEKLLKLSSKKNIIMLTGFVILIVILYVFFFKGGLGASSEKVDFKKLSKSEIPNAIEREVIPEYRELERALGCIIDGKVYVIVTRGECPTAGYKVSIESLNLEKGEEGSNLRVTASFDDPKADTAVERVSTYPYAVVETKLTSLPDSIELVSDYKE